MRQASIVQHQLQRAAPQLDVHIQSMQTQGDHIGPKEGPNTTGKGLFLKEIEESLLSGHCRLAVHSLKDVPFTETAGLTIAAVHDPEDPRDVLISKEGFSLSQLPHAAVIGTNSLRRRAQLLAARPDLRVMPLRGNVGTRLRRLFEGSCDAIVLAAAGLQRLGPANMNLTIDNMHFLEVMQWLPAPCQGVLALQCRSDDEPMLQLLKLLDEPEARQRTTAERTFAARLGADCRSALAAYGLCSTTLTGQALELHGWVATPDGEKSIRLSRSGPASQAITLGDDLAEDFLRAGAARVLHGSHQLT